MLKLPRLLAAGVPAGLLVALAAFPANAAALHGQVSSAAARAGAAQSANQHADGDALNSARRAGPAALAGARLPVSSTPLMAAAPSRGAASHPPARIFPAGVCTILTHNPGDAAGQDPFSVSISNTMDIYGNGTPNPALDIIALGVSTDGTNLTGYIKVVNLDPIGRQVPGNPGVHVPDNPGYAEKWEISWGGDTGHWMGVRWPTTVDAVPYAQTDLPGVANPASGTAGPPTLGGTHVTTGTYAEFNYGDREQGYFVADGTPNGVTFRVQGTGTGAIDWDNNTLIVTAPLAALGLNAHSLLTTPGGASQQMILETPLISSPANSADVDDVSTKTPFRLGTHC